MIHYRSLLLCSVCLGACGAVDAGNRGAVDAGNGVTVTISPESPATTDDLVATVQGAPGITFRWSVNGGARPDVTTYRVGATLTTKHEIWKVEAVDGDKALASAAVTIANSPPTLPTIAAPTAPIAAAPIQCTVGAPSTDADGDPLQTTVAWTLNGAPFTSTIMTVVPNDTIPPVTSHTGYVFACKATVTDSEATVTATAPATVAPRIAYMIKEGVTPQVLQTIDLDSLLITDVGLLSGATISAGDLAWDRVTQVLYMTDGNTSARALYKINTATGAATLIGGHGLNSAHALAFDLADNNRLYATGIDPATFQFALYRVNVANGAPTLIADYGAAPLQGMAFDSKRNVLLGATVSGAFSSIDVTTGTLTPVGSAGSMNNFGMTYDPFIDRFWSVDTSSRLFSIDPNAAYTSKVMAVAIGQHAAIAIVLPPP